VRATAFILALIIACGALRADGPGEAGARKAAATFGSALTSGRAEALRPILPQRGKVRLTLVRMGPEQGAFGAQQVEALFRDFLSGASVGAFSITRFESDGASSALAHGKAAITDRDGRSERIGVHLALAPEDGRWVLREVKESPE
jgi:hypothetical protein